MAERAPADQASANMDSASNLRYSTSSSVLTHERGGAVAGVEHECVVGGEQHEHGDHVVVGDLISITSPVCQLFHQHRGHRGSPDIRRADVGPSLALFKTSVRTVGRLEEFPNSTCQTSRGVEASVELGLDVVGEDVGQAVDYLDRIDRRALLEEALHAFAWRRRSRRATGCRGESTRWASIG